MISRKNRGLVLSTLVVTVLAISGTVASAQTKVTVSSVPRTPQVQAGEAFDVDIMLDTSVPVRTAQVALGFDPALVEVVGVEEGPMLKQFATSQQSGETLVMPSEPKVDNLAGNVEAYSISVMGMMVEGGATGTGVFATYHMKSKAGVQGSSALTLSSVIIGDQNANQIPEAEVLVSSGQVGVGVAPPTVAALPTVAPAGSPTPNSEQVAVISAGGTTEAVAVSGSGGTEDDDGGLSTEMIIVIAGGVVALAVVALVMMRK